MKNKLFTFHYFKSLSYLLNDNIISYFEADNYLENYIDIFVTPIGTSKFKSSNLVGTCLFKCR